MLDQNSGEQRVVRPADLGGVGCAQSRTQIVERDIPGSGRPGGGQQQVAAALPAGIVEVEEGLLRGAIGVVDRDPGASRGKHLRQIGRAERWAGNPDRRRPLAPEMNEMGFAAALRAIQHQRRRRPCWPSVDPAERSSVAVGDQEVGARQRRMVRQLQRQRQLAHLRRPPPPCPSVARAVSGTIATPITAPLRRARGCAPSVPDRTGPTAPSSPLRPGSAETSTSPHRRRSRVGQAQSRLGRSAPTC